MQSTGVSRLPVPCSRDSCQSRSWPRPWSDATRHAPHLRPVHGWRCAAASGAAGCRAARPDERVRQAQHRQAQRDDRGFRGHDGGQPQDAARLRNVRMHLEGLRLAHVACRLCGHAMGFFGGVFCVCVCGGRKGIKRGAPDHGALFPAGAPQPGLGARALMQTRIPRPPDFAGCTAASLWR